MVIQTLHIWKYARVEQIGEAFNQIQFDFVRVFLRVAQHRLPGCFTWACCDWSAVITCLLNSA